MTVKFADIERANDLLEGNVVRTPMLHSPKLSELTGADIFVKFENHQVTNSFKDRGAFIKLSSLDAEARRNGVIAMSAGNHAQAVAYHARRLDIPATIVMPETTPFTKVERTRAHGAHIVLAGETLAESQTTAEEIIAEKGFTLVHPYDDDKIIAGQGTVAIEMLEAEPELEGLVIPIGGGGLMSGCAIAARHLSPDIEILGVEVKQYPSMYHAVRGRTGKCGGATLAEGIAVKNVSERTISICKQFTDDIRLVAEMDVERAIAAYLSEQKTVAEGAGACGLAAVLADPGHFRGRRIGLVLCGGNIDLRILASVIYRELERDQRIVNLRFKTDDRPGILGRIATSLGHLGANILEVSHQRMFLDTPAKATDIDFMIETRDGRHAEEIVATLESQGFVIHVLDAPHGQQTAR